MSAYEAYEKVKPSARYVISDLGAVELHTQRQFLPSRRGKILLVDLKDGPALVIT
jgi:hypothetical protein